MDIAEKKEVKPDQIDKVDIKDPDNLTGKYTSKARKLVSKTFAKRALQWSYLHKSLISYLLLILYEGQKSSSIIFISISL